MSCKYEKKKGKVFKKRERMISKVLQYFSASVITAMAVFKIN